MFEDGWGGWTKYGYELLTGFDIEHTIIFVISCHLGSFLCLVITSRIWETGLFIIQVQDKRHRGNDTTHFLKHDKHMTTNHKPKSQETSHITNEVRLFWYFQVRLTWDTVKTHEPPSHWAMRLHISWDRQPVGVQEWVTFMFLWWMYQDPSPSFQFGDQ